MTIALYHFHVTQIKRSAGQSAVAAAAYRSGEKLHSEYYGEDSDYTRKGGVICSEILLPPQAPPSFSDRETLWNAVEKVERGKRAQLAYSFDIALQNEFSMQENIELARHFLLEQCVSRGMVVGFLSLLNFLHGVPENFPVCILRRSMGRQKDFRTDHAALAGVVAVLTVILAVQLFAGAIGGSSHRRLSSTSLDLGHMKMIECDSQAPPNSFLLCSLTASMSRPLTSGKARTFSTRE